MGFKGALAAYGESYFGLAGGYFLDNVNCVGEEEHLMYCEHGGFLTSDCTPDEAAGVECAPIGKDSIWLFRNTEKGNDLNIII